MAQLDVTVGASLWIPDSAVEFAEAVADGRFSEDHFHDQKRSLGPGAKGNRDLAIDLASFSVDGGLILLGAVEKPPQAVPLNLDGLREKIDQIARSRPDPPLWVEVRELPLDADEANGYAVILVPPSPDAPHQVDGRYRGRSDTTNIVLSDSDVRRIRIERDAARKSPLAELDSWQARDPVPIAEWKNAHVYVLALPRFARPAMAVNTFGTEASGRIGGLVRQAPPVTEHWSHMLHSTHAFRPTPEGWSWWRSPDDEDGIVGVEITDSCAVRMMSGRAATVRMDRLFAIETVIGGGVLETVDLARRLGSEVGYLGTWDFAMRVVGLKGALSAYLGNRLDALPYPYESEVYQAITSASYAELTGDPNSVVRRLTARLNRALNGDAEGAMPRLK